MRWLWSGACEVKNKFTRPFQRPHVLKEKELLTNSRMSIAAKETFCPSKRKVQVNTWVYSLPTRLAKIILMVSLHLALESKESSLWVQKVYIVIMWGIVTYSWKVIINLNLRMALINHLSKIWKAELWVISFLTLKLLR